MFQKSKITPKWGKNIYNLWSCEFLEYQDPEKEKIIEPFRDDPKKVPLKKLMALRKLNKIACMDCRHYISQQCSLSQYDIQESAKKYNNVKPKCEICGFPLTFHQYLLQDFSLEKLCVPCADKKIEGTLGKKKKKKSGASKLEICEIILMSIVFLFTFGEAIFDNVFNWADYFFIGVLCLIPVGYIGYRLIRRRKRKKIEES